MTPFARAALVAVLAGQVGAWTAGVLPLPALLLALLVTPAAALAAPRLTAERARRAAGALVLGAALLALPAVSGGGGATGLRGVLGPLLVGVTAVQPLTWQRRREVQTGVLGALGLLVLGASFAPDVLVGLPLLAGWGAALVAGVLVGQERARESADVVLAAPGRPAAAAVPAALAAVLGLALFLLVPLPEDAGAAGRLAGQAATALQSGRALPGAYTGPRVDLRVRGELSDRPLLEVPAASPRLWRSGVYSDWDGTGWTTDSDLRRVRADSVGPADGPVRTDRVEVERRTDGVVFAPGPVVAVSLPGLVGVDDHGAVRGPTWPGYEVTTRVVTPTDAELAAARGADVDDPRWTALAPSVPARVRDLGRQLTAGAGSRVEAVRRVEAWLAANASYRLDSPVPGRGEDAVDRFLFVDRVGFCEQFAAAEVLLLRAAGVPARFVTGLAYGEDRDGGRRTFRERDLHAWVEVFHPGTGWVPSDPTPPSTQLASAPWRTKVAARVTALLRRAESVPGGRPALAAGLLALTAAVAVGVLLRRRRPRTAPRPACPGSPGGGAGPALAAFLRFDARLGAQRRRPAETLPELGQRLGLPDDVQQALVVVERECYARASPHVGPQGVPDSDAAVALLEAATPPAR